MTRRPWNIALGLVGVIVWSVVIGLPLFLFHLTGDGLLVGDRIHAAVLFIASYGLVFWLAAQPRQTRRIVPPKKLPPVKTTLPTAPVVQVFDAELVAENRPPENPLREENPVREENPTGQSLVLKVQNYFGSSRSRRVSLDPGDRSYTLLPGQELEITARAFASLPKFRVIESDQGTLVCVEGADVEVEVVVRPAADQKAADQKAADQKAADQKAADQKAADQKAADQKDLEDSSFVEQPLGPASVRLP
jgi:hypothetical protein